MSTGMQLTSEAAAVVIGAAYRVIHILFEDTYHGDHHLILTAGLGKGKSKNESSYQKPLVVRAADSLVEDLILAAKSQAREKAKNLLKKALDATIQILTEEEYQARGYQQQQTFYVVYQNGTRKHCCIYAQTPDDASSIFKSRFPDITAYSIFGKFEGEDLKQSGQWKRIPLETHLN